MGRALPVKYSEYFGAKRCESLKNENIRYDSCDIDFSTLSIAKSEISKF
jgi:hypothetical protein